MISKIDLNPLPVVAELKTLALLAYTSLGDLMGPFRLRTLSIS